MIWNVLSRVSLRNERLGVRYLWLVEILANPYRWEQTSRRGTDCQNIELEAKHINTSEGESEIEGSGGLK